MDKLLLRRENLLLGEELALLWEEIGLGDILRLRREKLRRTQRRSLTDDRMAGVRYAQGNRLSDRSIATNLSFKLFSKIQKITNSNKFQLKSYHPFFPISPIPSFYGFLSQLSTLILINCNLRDCSSRPVRPDSLPKDFAKEWQLAVQQYFTVRSTRPEFRKKYLSISWLLVATSHI